MKVAGLCLFLHFLFYEHLASVSDVDALLRPAQALTGKVVDSGPLFRLPEGRYACNQILCRLIVRTDDNPIALNLCAVGIINVIVFTKISTFRITDADAFAKSDFCIGI